MGFDPTDWTGFFSGHQRGDDLVNARGDKLNANERQNIFGSRAKNVFELDKNPIYDPVRAMALLNNWLTAGGAPKPIDPVDIFGPAQAMSGVEARASAGRGVAGLFGFGKLIGELAPSSGPAAGGPAVPGQAPLAPGVPYGAKPIPRSQGFFK